ncbi:hypothetical protein SKAU_G00106860 [Synaphobranchus kaupii]|uniref:Uncharacterized protein n=1 Tax=Synaphobranchus kaupii TaxID=118154 RepID=A0A9Q1FZG9_SYNKA|nr:hypothetical protein SKAU_G00106860 [Synaphobranchus kaupii]
MAKLCGWIPSEPEAVSSELGGGCWPSGQATPAAPVLVFIPGLISSQRTTVMESRAHGDQAERGGCRNPPNRRKAVPATEKKERPPPTPAEGGPLHQSPSVTRDTRVQAEGRGEDGRAK